MNNYGPVLETLTEGFPNLLWSVDGHGPRLVLTARFLEHAASQEFSEPLPLQHFISMACGVADHLKPSVFIDWTVVGCG